MNWQFHGYGDEILGGGVYTMMMLSGTIHQTFLLRFIKVFSLKNV